MLLHQLKANEVDIKMYLDTDHQMKTIKTIEEIIECIMFENSFRISCFLYGIMYYYNTFKTS